MKKIFLFINIMIIQCLICFSLNIGVLMPFASKDDPTFGYMVKKGLNAFAEKYPDINIEIVYPEKNTSFRSYINYFSLKCDYVIGAGFMYKNALEQEAAANLDVKYIIIDNKVDLPNVISISFDDYEAAFIAGACSGAFFKNWKIGFIGASPSYLTDRFYYGFLNGAKYSGYNMVIPRINLSKNNVGFVNPVKAYNEAEFMYENDISLIFAPCGSSSLGVLKAALKTEKYVIGIDRAFEELSDQGVLFSVSKRIDKILYKILFKSIIENDFKSGIYTYNFKNGGYEIPGLNRMDRIFGYRKTQWLKNLIKKINEGEIWL